MRIISYKYFTNPFDFEQWQERDKPEVVTVSPIISSANINNNLQNYGAGDSFNIESAELTYEPAIFVTYVKHIEEEK